MYPAAHPDPNFDDDAESTTESTTESSSSSSVQHGPWETRDDQLTRHEYPTTSLPLVVDGVDPPSTTEENDLFSYLGQHVVLGGQYAFSSCEHRTGVVAFVSANLTTVGTPY